MIVGIPKQIIKIMMRGKSLSDTDSGWPRLEHQFRVVSRPEEFAGSTRTKGASRVFHSRLLAEGCAQCRLDCGVPSLRCKGCHS